MSEHTTVQNRGARAAVAAPPDGFSLTRYFATMTLGVVVAVGIALWLLQGMEETYFAQAQAEQRAFFAGAQAQLADQHEAAARDNLVTAHEASHVNLTRLVANVFWETDIAPLIMAVQRLPAFRCRTASGAAGSATTESDRRACDAMLQRAIVALPAFKAVDRKAFATMRATTVFKIKVFDMRGTTVYSSEHSQVGEDASENAGWRAAAGGLPASELTRRNRFSAFERVVENRDLISSYVPVRATGKDEVLGVFELYSDVTPFLDQIKAANRTFAEMTAANEARIASRMRANQEAVEASSVRFLSIVGGLIGLLYVASLVVVRRGQRIIDRQRLAQERSAQREQRWHREKMAALATMTANVSHEVGNPMAVIWSVTEDLQQREGHNPAVADATRQILEQSARIATMTRQIADFANARSESPQWIDVNAQIKSICDFMAFDRRFRNTAIEFRAGAQLPAREIVPDHLSEVMMNLMLAQVDDSAGRRVCSRLVVGTELRGEDIVIRVSCADTEGGTEMLAAPIDVHADSVGRRVAEMGGRMSLTERGVDIMLPPPTTRYELGSG